MRLKTTAVSEIVVHCVSRAIKSDAGHHLSAAAIPREGEGGGDAEDAWRLVQAADIFLVDHCSQSVA